MRKLQIFLLILIIIGIGLIATQKYWVPKVVNQIITEEWNQAMREGKVCFNYKHAKTDTEPYDVEEDIVFSIWKGKITGTKTGTQSGPDMTNGYQGTIKGEKVEDRLELVFDYIVEGSHNKEFEIYQIEQPTIVKQRWALKEERGMLVPDKVGEPKLLVYNQVECESNQ